MDATCITQKMTQAGHVLGWARQANALQSVYAGAVPAHMEVGCQWGVERVENREGFMERWLCQVVAEGNRQVLAGCKASSHWARTEAA